MFQQQQQQQQQTRNMMELKIDNQCHDLLDAMAHGEGLVLRFSLGRTCFCYYFSTALLFWRTGHLQ